MDEKNEKHQENESTAPPKRPKMNPYVVTVLIIGFGLYCAWDGWFSSNEEMLKYSTFNRVAALVLLAWGVYDFFKVRKHYRSSSDDTDKSD